MPHNGCAHQCSFCNQTQITGVHKQPTPADVVQAIKTAAQGDLSDKTLELAFFGGSFTALNEQYMVSLLEAAQPFVTGGIITGIRVSTRPDAIDDSILHCLKHYHVTAIELGAQSMVDSVLQANRRGHTAQQVRQASEQILAHGFSLGLQMMTGLYQDTPQGARHTAQEIAACKPHTVRIYPTVVMPGTHLAQLHRSGQYTPLTLAETVALCSDLLAFFAQRQIAVIRLGLHASPELEQERLAGPYHPALRELCESHCFYRSVLATLSQNFAAGGSFTVAVHPKELSKAVGQKKENLQRFAAQGYRVTVIPCNAVHRGTFQIQPAYLGRKEAPIAAQSIGNSWI